MRRATLLGAGVSALAVAVVFFVDPPPGVPLDDPVEDARTAALDRKIRAAERCRTTRREIARAVADGRMDFADGAALFLEMLREIPGEVEVARNSYRGPTEAEIAGQQLRAFVVSLDLPYDRQAEVIARLDEQFKALYPTKPG